MQKIMPSFVCDFWAAACNGFLLLSPIIKFPVEKFHLVGGGFIQLFIAAAAGFRVEIPHAGSGKIR